MGERTKRGTLDDKVIAGHQLQRLLAHGGMGDVYLAKHLKLGVERAIKVIRSNQRLDPVATERFKREARVLSQLQHESIIRIIDFGGLDNGWPYFIMEYVEGQSLEDVIAKRGPLSLADALVVLEQIAGALVYAHRGNVIHRDLKPGNVLLRDGDVNQVKLIDFGLAHVITDDPLNRITNKGQMLGSPAYMAPEQAEGLLDITPAVDVYALAGVAYTVLSGKPVFEGRKAIELMHAHMTKSPQRLAERCIDLPPLLDDLLSACLTKEPKLRPRAEDVRMHFARLARDAIGEAMLDDTVADGLAGKER